MRSSLQTDRKILPDAKSLIESLRSIGYNFKSAVADLIDNSISADSTNIDIIFEPDVSPYLSILDNGMGMNEIKLYEAMKFGSQDPNISRSKKDLGRFGLGLKSASLSQCREFIVITKKDSKIFSGSWDLDYISKVNDWKIKLYQESDLIQLNLKHYYELLSQKSGTIVLWRKFDRLNEGKSDFKSNFLEQIEQIEDHLALIFHRFLNDEQNLEIKINGNKVLATDPFLKKNLATQKKETQLKEIDNETITVTPYVLPHINKMTKEEIISLGGKSSLKQNQGYYIYRNKRLIIWGKWFNQYPKAELAKLVRVQVDIPNTLDYLWEIDVKKSQAVIPQSIRKNLGMMINDSLNSSHKVIKYRGRKKNRNEIIRVWNRFEEREFIRYEINKEHPLIAKLLDSTVEKKDAVLQVLGLIQNNIPSYQLYLDEAESIKSISNFDLFDSSQLSLWTSLIDSSSQEQNENFIENISNIEGVKLTDDEITALKNYIVRKYNGSK